MELPATASNEFWHRTNFAQPVVLVRVDLMFVGVRYKHERSDSILSSSTTGASSTWDGDGVDVCFEYRRL